MTTSLLPTRAPRGQVLALACVVLLTCALMMMASFSVANAVHERTRLQAAADAHAFTVATLEARGMNTVAFMNRAIAGAIVAEMGIHAWRALARHNVNMYQAGMMAFIIVGIIALAQCPKFNFPHCVHAFQAWKIAAKFNKTYKSKKSQLEGKDNDWKDAVKAYSDMIKTINEDQKKILDKVKSEIGTTSITLNMMLSKTAPKASISTQIAKYNTSGFACALEGSNFDDDCDPPSWKNAGTVKGADERTKIMESAAMAARPLWQVGGFLGRSASDQGYRGFNPIGNPIINPSNMTDIMGEGTYIEFGFPSKSKVSNNTISAESGAGGVFVQWKHGFGVGFVANGKHPSTSSDYEGVPCDGSGGCFMNFRSINEGGETDYGQPATYGAITQELRVMGTQGAPEQRPWELNGTGEVKMPAGTGKFKYVTEGTGYGMAKAKTYFHQIDSWAAPPNLFDPFWRAKLHPFVRDELKELLTKVGDSNGQQIIGSGQTAVEGVTE